MMRTADNRNGTFTNPLIFADYPDPDIVRVGNDFYLASSSFTDAPGIPICHSRDLVNWQIVGHVYNRLPESNPDYSMTGGKAAYRGGSWAPSIRYNRGTYYVAFCTPAEGFFLAQSNCAAGPYELHWFGGVELYDPGLFIEEDRIYVVHGGGDIFLSELTADGNAIAGGPKFLYSTPTGFPFEGSHVHRVGDWYYVFNAGRGYNGIQVVSRSKSLDGPYESRILTADDLNYSGAGLHQGGLVDLPNGEFWFYCFQDRDYVGRVPILMPVRWRDGWPEVGDPNNFGKIAVTCAKPAVSGALCEPCATEGPDHFETTVLAMRWHWNHNPDDLRWSLTERSGWLRLHSGFAPDLLHARNTLIQKITGGGCIATTRLDTAAMLPGDIAGLCVLAMPYAFIGVECTAGGRRFIMVNDGHLVAEAPLPASGCCQLRAEAAPTGRARFAFACDGSDFVSLGDELIMQFSVRTFLGNKFGLFCFNTVAEACCGHADFDYLDYECTRGGANHYRACETIPAASCDSEHGTHPWRAAEKQPMQYLSCINAGDRIWYDHIDFEAGATRFRVAANNAGDEARIELRLSHPDGALLGECAIPARAGRRALPPEWNELHSSITPTSGVHKICLCFSGGNYHLWLRDFSFY